jgi:hypothetical protein
VDAHRLELDLCVRRLSFDGSDIRAGLILYIWSLLGPVILPDRFD